MATAPQPPDPTWQFISGAGQGIQAFPFASGWLVRGSGTLFFVPGIDPLSGSGTGTASILAAIADLKQTAETLGVLPTQQLLSAVADLKHELQTDNTSITQQLQDTFEVVTNKRAVSVWLDVAHAVMGQQAVPDR